MRPFGPTRSMASGAESVSAIKVNDDVSPQTGVVPVGGATNDDSPLLSGTYTGTLDVGEDIRNLRNQIRGDSGRDPHWTLGPETNLGAADVEKSTSEKLLFHVDLPARDKDGKAEKITKKLHIFLKSEW